jgi:predicted  nucleic acid-binding Zn-ribbon protein
MARYRVVPRKVIPADYINDMKQRIDNLRRAVVQKNEEIERLKGVLRSLAKERAEVLKQKEALEREKEAFSKEKAALEDIKKDNARLSDENAKLNESIRSLESQLKSYDERIKEYEEKIRGYEERIKEYEERIKESKENASQLEAVIKQKDEEISRLNEAISEHQSTIMKLNESLEEKERVKKDRDDTISEYASRTSELNKYLLEVRELKLSDRSAMLLFKTTLAAGIILAAVGAIFAIFAGPLVFSLGIENALRIKIAVTLLGIALPLCMISITYRLFATRLSVLYLNATGFVVAVATMMLFDMYYPENFLHPFAGTLYFLYTLSAFMLFTAVILSLPRIHEGSEEPEGPEKQETAKTKEKEETEEEMSEEDLFKLIDN